MILLQEKKRILIVDDEEKIIEVLSAYLSGAGYAVYEARDGAGAVDMFDKVDPALVILDLMLPDILGEDICKLIRARSRTPIIMLTAKSEEHDIVGGLHSGADDYITKPFKAKEVLARVDAVLRRVSGDHLIGEPIAYGDGSLVIDFKNYTIKRHGEEIVLTPTEYKILSTLAKTPGKVFTRDELIQYALNDEFTGNDRSIDTYVKNIRQKIEINPKKPTHLMTVHGLGYRFDAGR